MWVQKLQHFLKVWNQLFFLNLFLQSSGHSVGKKIHKTSILTLGAISATPLNWNFFEFYSNVHTMVTITMTWDMVTIPNIYRKEKQCKLWNIFHSLFFPEGICPEEFWQQFPWNECHRDLRPMLEIGIQSITNQSIPKGSIFVMKLTGGKTSSWHSTLYAKK